MPPWPKIGPVESSSRLRQGIVPAISGTARSPPIRLRMRYSVACSSAKTHSQAERPPIFRVVAGHGQPPQPMAAADQRRRGDHQPGEGPQRRRALATNRWPAARRSAFEGRGRTRFGRGRPVSRSNSSGLRDGGGDVVGPPLPVGQGRPHAGRGPRRTRGRWPGCAARAGRAPRRRAPRPGGAGGSRSAARASSLPSSRSRRIARKVGLRTASAGGVRGNVVVVVPDVLVALGADGPAAGGVVVPVPLGEDELADRRRRGRAAAARSPCPGRSGPARGRPAPGTSGRCRRS